MTCDRHILVLLLAALFMLIGPVASFSQVEPDIKDLRNRAESGRDLSAQCELGECYIIGMGVPPDDKQAVYWYRKASIQGCAPAQFLLGKCYYDGKGVLQDYKQAYAWAIVAASNGERRLLEDLVEKVQYDVQVQARYCGSC